ncbi:uncharacterized protein TNCV_698211 [Trichonephila clavipes]|nr:uncharacterized protein TNCV_698211 [Trichonephila clavipes]
MVGASDSRPEGLGTGEYFPPLQFTCRNCGGGDRGRVAIYRPFGKALSLNRTVTCMVLKANDRRTSCPCHDEFRGPCSDYVRQITMFEPLRGLYAERHPVRRTPAHTMFARLHQQLCETGSFQKAARNRDWTARTELNEEIVLDMVETTPSLSTRGIANEIGFHTVALEDSR